MSGGTPPVFSTVCPLVFRPKMHFVIQQNANRYLDYSNKNMHILLQTCVEYTNEGMLLFFRPKK